MKRTAIFILAALLTLSLIPAATAEGFTQAQVKQAEIVRDAMSQQGDREVQGSGVYYTWRSDWYALGYDRQLRTMRMIADSEYVASSGTITHMHIEYAGQTVAEATPMGGVKVLKSRP